MIKQYEDEEQEIPNIIKYFNCDSDSCNEFEKIEDCEVFNPTSNITDNNLFDEQENFEGYDTYPQICDSEENENNPSNEKNEEKNNKKKVTIFFYNKKNLFYVKEIKKNEYFTHFNENFKNEKEILLNENQNQLEYYDQISHKKIKLRSDDIHYKLNKLCIDIDIQLNLISERKLNRYNYKLFKICHDIQFTLEKKNSIKMFNVEKYTSLGQKRKK